MSDDSSTLVIMGALAGNAAIAVSKFIAAFFTRSSVMIAEGIHSLVDTGDAVLLLLAKHRAKKPPDRNHPFGHGMEVYFWNFVVALIIFGLGGGMSIYEGILHLLHPEKVTNILWNYVVLGVAAFFEGMSWVLAFRHFRRFKPPRLTYIEAIRRSKDPSTFTVFLEDSAALLGIGIAFIGLLLSQLQGWEGWDGVASILIGLLLTGIAFLLAKEARGLLIGESADPDKVRKIQKIVEDDPRLSCASHPLTMQLGPDDILVCLSVKTDSAAEECANGQDVLFLETKIRKALPDVRYVFTRVESEDEEKRT